MKWGQEAFNAAERERKHVEVANKNQTESIVKISNHINDISSDNKVIESHVNNLIK